MGVQKTYSYATGKGVAGGIYDMFHYPVDSRFNEEENGKLHFGVGVVTGKVPGSSVALPTSASTADNFEAGCIAVAPLIPSGVLSPPASTASRIWRASSTS